MPFLFAILLKQITRDYREKEGQTPQSETPLGAMRLAPKLSRMGKILHRGERLI